MFSAATRALLFSESVDVRRDEAAGRITGIIPGIAVFFGVRVAIEVLAEDEASTVVSVSWERPRFSVYSRYRMTRRIEKLQRQIAEYLSDHRAPVRCAPVRQPAPARASYRTRDP